MSLKISVYIATSLDGYIARPDGNLDWLLNADTSANDPGEDHGYADYMRAVDTLVMGRHTFEKVLTFEHWPYRGKRVVVLSSTLAPADMPGELAGQVEVHPGPVRQLAADLAASGARHVYADGGKVIQALLAESLIDEMTLTRIPVLIGGGIPLFGPLRRDMGFELLSTRSFKSGFVQSTYRAIKHDFCLQPN